MSGQNEKWSMRYTLRKTVNRVSTRICARRTYFARLQPLGWSFQSFIRGGSALGEVPTPYSFIEERNPFHVPTKERYIPFLNPWNEVNEQYYGKTSSITRRYVIHKTKKNSFIHTVPVHDREISIPFHLPQLVKSIPFTLNIPEA